MAKINTNDSTIHYIIEKQTSTETIVFLHGVGLDQTEFTYLFPYLKNYQLLSIDLRWHGNSKGEFYPEDEDNWDALFQDYLSVMDKEHIENYHIVSHGIGAQLAVELISRGIVKPTTLTVLSTPFYYPPNALKEGAKYRLQQIKGMTGKELGEWMIPQITITDDLEKQELIKAAFEKVNRNLYMDILRLNARALSLKKLTKLTMPTLLLNGELDVNYPPEITSLGAKYLPDCRTKIIQNASNMVHIDQPKETATIIDDFIQENNYRYKRRKKNLDLPYLSLLRRELESEGLRLVRIDFLTVFRMEVDGKVVEGKLNQRKAKELMAYLAYYGKVTKEKVFDALWPNASLQSAKNSLRVTIHHLRTLLKDAGIDDFIFTDTQYVWLNEKADIRCDVKEVTQGKRIVRHNQIFSDMPFDWVLEIPYEW
jgi:pimeloyl-ACP methyl ester carboxylesterase